ncbi:MAG: sulfatase-like hydrolase/transferase [Deltaproteobacteria bacterium]|nr:sulfatase-like hydrolase/transferase [Deltaproteobacteria bacterium]
MKKNALSLAVAALIAFIAIFVAQNFFAAWLTFGNFSISGFIKFFIKILFLHGFAGMILVLLPRPLSWLFLFINFAANVIIFSWNKFLGDVPTVSAVHAALANNIAESINIWAYVYLPALVPLLCAFIISVCLLNCVQRQVKLRLNMRRRLLGVFLCCAIVGSGMSLYVNQRHGMSWRHIEGLVPETIAQRGYFAVWIAEIFNPLIPGEEMTSSSKLADTLPLFTAGKNFVYIQVECLGDLMIGRKAGGNTIMPFLTELARKGMLLRVNGIKKLGSANSDYEFLNTRIANPLGIYYNLLESYPDSLAGQFKKRGGMTSSVFHGYTGEFFDRRKGMLKMGFENIFFREELLAQGYMLYESNFTHVEDRELFSFAANKISLTPFFHVVITTTMHDVAANIDPLFTGDEYAAFFTHARWTDDGIKTYINALPPDTTVVIMGDHAPYVGPDTKYTPCIIYNTSGSTPEFEQDGIATRTDISHYVRRLYALDQVSPHIRRVDE